MWSNRINVKRQDQHWHFNYSVMISILNEPILSVNILPGGKHFHLNVLSVWCNDYHVIQMFRNWYTVNKIPDNMITCIKVITQCLSELHWSSKVKLEVNQFKTKLYSTSNWKTLHLKMLEYIVVLLSLCIPSVGSVIYVRCLVFLNYCPILKNRCT